MKIAYLHGLESSIDKKDPKIIFMNSAFDEVYAPSINYKDPSTFNKLFNDIKKLQPDLIVGSSMGGYVSYLIGSKLSIETILFNPAMIGRSFDPIVDNSSLRGSTHNIYSGKNDKVIDGEAVKKYFNEEGIGNFKYNYYNGEHRVPSDVFINAIKNVLKISEINKTMKYIKLFENFVNESKFKVDDTWEWHTSDGVKLVKIVNIKPNGDIIGRVDGDSQDFIVRDANKYLKKKLKNSK